MWLRELRWRKGKWGLALCQANVHVYVTSKALSFLTISSRRGTLLHPPRPSLNQGLWASLYFCNLPSNFLWEPYFFCSNKSPAGSWGDPSRLGVLFPTAGQHRGLSQDADEPRFPSCPGQSLCQQLCRTSLGGWALSAGSRGLLLTPRPGTFPLLGLLCLITSFLRP